MVLKFLTGCGFLLILLTGSALGQEKPRIEFVDGDVRATNLDQHFAAALARRHNTNEAWSSIFPVYTLAAHRKGLGQPIQGHYSLIGTTLTFKPLFSFASGESYYAALDCGIATKLETVLNKGEHIGDKFELTFSIPGSDTPPTFVVEVYPDADTLPENLLRMYVHFSAPMSRGEAYEHIQLFDENMNVVQKPFLVIDQELWDKSKTRFTLLFDPGRIKRGLKSNIDLGVPLHVNHFYTLFIDSLWRDEQGKTLSGTYKKRFFIKGAQRSTLSTQDWRILVPQADTKDPLIIQFDRIIDHALAVKYISVVHPLKGVIYGTTLLKNHDTTWLLTPDRGWSTGSYTLQISPHLEDPAGNNFNNPFDINLSLSRRVSSGGPIEMDFVVKGAVK